MFARSDFLTCYPLEGNPGYFKEAKYTLNNFVSKICTEESTRIIVLRVKLCKSVFARGRVRPDAAGPGPVPALQRRSRRVRSPRPQYTVHQLLPSLGISPPVMSRIRSTNHQIPSPPRVSSFPTAVPVWPRQNRSTPKQPRKKE